MVHSGSWVRLVLDIAVVRYGIITLIGKLLGTRSVTFSKAGNFYSSGGLRFPMRFLRHWEGWA